MNNKNNLIDELLEIKVVMQYAGEDTLMIKKGEILISRTKINVLDIMHFAEYPDDNGKMAASLITLINGEQLICAFSFDKLNRLYEAALMKISRANEPETI